MGLKYMKMFDTNLVAMSFYDKDGMLIDVNDNMRHLCEFDEEGEKYFRQTRLFDAPLIKDPFDPSGHDNCHVGQKMHYPDIGIDKYIEFRITPTFCFEVPFSNRLVRVWYQQGQNYLGEFRPLMAIKSKI